MALTTEAQVVLAAQASTLELSELISSGWITLPDRPVTAALFRGAELVFVATGCPAADAEAAGFAKSARAESAIAAGGPPAVDIDSIGFVDLGSRDRDLIPLYGVQRLQAAEVIFCDRLIDPGTLAFARRNADRGGIGGTAGRGLDRDTTIRPITAAACGEARREVDNWRLLRGRGNTQCGLCSLRSRPWRFCQRPEAIGDKYWHQ